MRLPLALVALVLLAAPAPAADDISALYPESTLAVLTVDIAKAVGSPLGKKVIGTDKPFTATRKLVSVLLDDGALKFPDAAQNHLAEVANKLDRVTLVVAMKPNGPLSVLVFFEGANTEGDYIKAVEGYAKAEDDKLEIEKRGERKLLSLTKSRLRGASVNKSVFVAADKADLLTEVLDKADGKQKASDNKLITDAIKQAKLADTPIWLVIAHEQLGTGVATITLKDDAEIRLEYRAAGMDFTQTVKDALATEFLRMSKRDTRQGRLWAAADLTVKIDDKAVIATGKFPGKLLAEDYAKQK